MRLPSSSEQNRNMLIFNNYENSLIGIACRINLKRDLGMIPI